MGDVVNNGSTPIYFYSTVKDECSSRGFTFPATNNTAKGALCSYLNDAPPIDLWACPAGDSVCWTTSKPCPGGGPKIAGNGQLVCQQGASSWCCDSTWEKCSDQSGVCWAKNFNNPLQNVQPSLASEIAQSAIAAKETGTILSVPTQLSVRPSTTTVPIPGTTSLLTSGSAKGITSVFASTGTLSSGKTTATSLNSEPAMPSSKLSKGAIAGIVVTAVAFLAFLGAASFYIYKRRKNRSPLVQDLSSDSDTRRLHSSTPATEVRSLPSMALVTQDLSPVGVQEIRELKSVKNSPEERESPSEADFVVSPLEESPLQTLIRHGRYPNHD